MSVRRLREMLDSFDRTPAAVGYELRMSLAALVLRRLDALGWTQKQLADAAGMNEPFVSRVIHGDQNCTFDVAGRLLFALGVKAKLAESEISTGRASGSPSHANGRTAPRKRAGEIRRRAAG